MERMSNVLTVQYQVHQEVLSGVVTCELAIKYTRLRYAVFVDNFFTHTCTANTVQSSTVQLVVIDITAERDTG